jgi:Tol biopolymer transport system component
MGEMPANPIQLLGAGLVVIVGLAATSGAASAPATGSRLAADAAQDKSKIAFISRDPQRVNGLYVVNADGSGQRRLTGNVKLSTLAWSPDGRRIAFESVRDRTPTGVYVVNADGSFLRRLARKGSVPAWSPDGRKIAFVSGTKIYLMNADGSEHLALTKPLDGHKKSLAWSPDGRKFAFASYWDCAQDCGLYVLNSDGSGLRDLTSKLATGHGKDPGSVFGSAWSPDGRKLAFVRSNAGLGNSIYVVNADGSGLRRLTRNPALDWGAAPTWSPDGRKLAFASERDGNSEVYVMNANGSGRRNLTRDPAFDGDPAWSPDGRSIAFRSTRDGNTEVYIMNADGSWQRNLTRSPANEGRFAWAPGRSKQGAS